MRRAAAAAGAVVLEQSSGVERPKTRVSRSGWVAGDSRRRARRSRRTHCAGGTRPRLRGRPAGRRRGGTAAGAATHPVRRPWGRAPAGKTEPGLRRTRLPCAANPVSLVFAVPPNEAENRLRRGWRGPRERPTPGVLSLPRRPAGQAARLAPRVAWMDGAPVSRVNVTLDTGAARSYTGLQPRRLGGPPPASTARAPGCQPGALVFSCCRSPPARAGCRRCEVRPRRPPGAGSRRRARRPRPPRLRQQRKSPPGQGCPWTLRGRRQQGNAAAREETRTTGSPPRRLAGAPRLPAAPRHGSETRNGSLGEAARRLPAGGHRIAVTITRPRPGVKDRMDASQRHCSARDRRPQAGALVLDSGRTGPLACTGTPGPGATRLERGPRFGGDPSAHRRTAARPAHGAFS